MNEHVINKSGNKHCFLCGGKNPSWGCLPFAVLACTKCAGGMRELGTGVCTVKSLLLDSVDSEFLRPFMTGSNAVFLDWYGERSKEELSPSFFKSPLAKEYVEALQRGDVREKAATSAPVITPGAGSSCPSSRAQKKSKLRFASANESEPVEEAPAKEETPAEREVCKKKSAIRRVPGRIVSSGAEGADRLGMFRNVESAKSEASEGKSPEITPSKYAGERSTRVFSGGAQHSSEPAEIVRGKNFIGSTPAQKESVSDRLKKSLEKGKKTLLNTFKK
ncbi:uncharacterized protein NEMAJ01_1447 [Nematocida major]|uniref:uncharacterized protein n=1 Tax=Nematocida major TaxID=1912982 RepID=UPI002007BBBB|nr:uncharacterized protein NEMAJ01_1447 [Nematocida major]KAH9386551.1 hypothetical protein NEMAJ01_1447 [Nematocida major]